jgi:hypothetical protein
VNTLNGPSYPSDGKYNFVTGTTIGLSYGGFIQYETTSSSNQGSQKVNHQVCVAPIIPPDGTFTSPFEVRFWVIGIDCCGGASTVSACANANSNHCAPLLS